MKKLFIVSLVMAALAFGCSKETTTPVTTAPTTEPTTEVIASDLKNSCPVVTCPVCPAQVVCPAVVTCPVVTCPTTPTTPVVTTPTPTTAKLKVLDSFSYNPGFAPEALWKSEVKRTIFTDQVTGYAVKGDLCLLVGKAQKMLGITTKYPSAKEYKVGKYFGPLVELTKDNCKDAEYAWMDLTDSYNENGLSITITKSGVGGAPYIPFMVELSPYSFATGINKSTANSAYVNGMENWVLPTLQLLRDHRITTYKSWVVDYDINASFPFSKFVPCEKRTNVPWNLLDANNVKMNTALKDCGPWVYVVDEPDAAALLDKKATLQKIKSLAPNVSTMVTTTYQEAYKDLIDIWVPVMEHADLVKRDLYKRMGLYTSCMVHGCDPDRFYIYKKVNKQDVHDPNNFVHHDYAASGAPDLTLDAPPSDAFKFFMVGLKYNVEFLLYYNSIELWKMGQTDVGVDIFTDPYNFGGNADGNLLWPDYANKSAYPSYELKMLREASWMINAAAKNGKLEVLKARVTNALKSSFDDSLRDEMYKP